MKTKRVFKIQLAILVSFFMLLFLMGCPCGKKSPTQPPPVNDPAAGRVDQQPAWSPDGSKIVFVHFANYSIQGDSVSGIYFINSDGTNRRLFFRCVWDSGGFYRGLIYNPKWSPDGRWLVFSMGAQIWKIKANGDSLIQLTSQGENFFPDYSPDGSKIIFDSDVNAYYADYGIWVMDVNGNSKIQITQNGRMPFWSPDGNKIVHMHYLPIVGYTMYVMDANGQNLVRLVNDSSVTDGVPKYSPDGTKIVFERQLATGNLYPRVWIMDADGSNTKKLTEGAAEGPSWSPDGNKIVFMNLLVDGKLWTMNPDGSGKKPLTP